MVLSMTNTGLNLCHLSKIHDLKDLVPGPGHYIYSEGLARRFWWIIWTIVEKLTKRECIMPKALKSAEKTHEAFREHLKQIQTDVKLLKEQAKRKIQGQSLTRAEIEKRALAEKRMMEWHTWISPVLHNHVVPNAKDLTKILDSLSSDDNDKLLVDSYIADCGSQGPISVARLESKMGLAFPYQSMKKLLKNELDQSLKFWVEKLGGIANGNGLLHKALLSLFKPQEVTYIEYMLVEKTNAKFILKPDSVQVEWRESLKKSKTITFPHKNLFKTITLDQPLGDVKKKDLRHSYSIKNDKKHVVVVPANCSNAGLEETLSNVSKCPFPKRLKIYHIDLEGRYVLMERFGSNLQGYEWNKDTKQDDVIKKQISRLVKGLIKGKYTPKDLAPEFLLYETDAKELKTHKVFLLTQFNFIAMEQFLYECSKGDATIYNALMKESGLQKHEQADFVKEYINTILEDDPDPDSMFIVHNITDVNFKDSARQLRKDIQRFVRDCKKSIQLKTVKKISNVEKVIKAAILKDRGNEKSHFRIPDNYKDTIVKKVLKK